MISILRVLDSIRLAEADLDPGPDTFHSVSQIEKEVTKPHDLLVLVSYVVVHSQPINLVVYQGSSGACARDVWS